MILIHLRNGETTIQIQRTCISVLFNPTCATEKKNKANRFCLGLLFLSYLQFNEMGYQRIADRSDLR